MFFLPKPQLLGVLGALTFGGQAVQGIELDLSDTNSIKQAASTIAYGMMTYYTGNETGQPIGLLPPPYYWWEAGAMFGQMIEYWYYTGDSTYNAVVTQGLLAQVGPDNDYMPPNQTKTEGNDDQAFWAFAVMSAVELNFPDPPAGKPSWLSLAQAVFNEQAGRWDTTACGGGLRWQIFTWNNGYEYKNSISNGGFFQLAARLARYTSNQTYADWADKSYDWIIKTPLFTSDYLVYDGADMADNCTVAGQLQWTYNIGTYLMGAANMWNYTNGSSTWESRIQGMLKGVEVFFPQQYGGGKIMVEVACEPEVTCNYDQPSFKAYLSRWMAATTQLAPFTYDTIRPLLYSSAQGAAGQCSGGNDGQTCGRMWYKNTWDGKSGVGEQMSALSVIQANLISKVSPPVTESNGGTSKGDPSAGSASGGGPTIMLGSSLTRKITAGDKAGAGIVTAIICSGLHTLIIRIPCSSGINPSLSSLFNTFLPRSLIPQGNKAFTFTTSPNKKRKLSLPEASQSTSNVQEISTDPAKRLTSSPSPPAYLPKHLVLEGARTGRSPTPELSTTAASSPSGAYAGLTLDSDGYASGTETAGPNKRRGSLASSGLRGGTSSPIRSSSPAKRRASAMVNDDVNMESQDGGSISGNGTIDTTSGANTARRNSKSQGTRHKREASVDMLAQELDPRSTTSSTSSTPGNDGTSSSTSSMPTPADVPTIDDQINQVQQLVQQGSMREGQKGYIVATKWLNRVLARGTDGAGSEKYGKEAREGAIGPVDNTGINLVTDRNVYSFKDEAGEQFVPLAPGLNLGEDFEILPEAAWNLIIKWYKLAKGSTVIRRYCHNTSTSETRENLQYELHPPVFTILKLPNRSDGLTAKALKEKDATPVKILASRHELYQTFLKRAKMSAGIDMGTKVRVWRILGGLGGNSGSETMTPAQSRSNSPAPGAILSVDPGTKLVVDANDFAGLQLGSQRELVDVNDETANVKYNGHMTLDVAGLRQNEVIVLEEMIGGPGGGEWVSDNAASKIKSHGNVPISVTKSGNTTVKDSLKPTANTSRAPSPAPTGIMTRGRTAKNGRVRGTVGLSNLGNTCYMNSALQCVRSVEELTHYFLEDRWKPELNTDNPLGHNGAVAKSYANLLKDMYAPNSLSSFAPRNFKNVIGKYGPSFSGWQQQDSQEFLLFLLDGLQEDLNRVKKKPYVEKPDSTDEMVHDPVALRQMADKCWDIYKARSDSVITDLFAGMYKSTVICPVCDKVSIIFDPFNNLTLQLPIESLWSKPIFYFPLNGRPISVAVDIDKNASFMALKEYVAGKFPGVEAQHMVVVEIYKNKFYKFFSDKASISDEHIVDADQIAIYELEAKPTNYPPPKKKSSGFKMSNFNRDDDDIPEGQSPLAENMLVPVFHRRGKDSSSKYPQKQLFGAPLFVIITPDEARDYDRILQKVLARVANMTTRDFLREDAVSQDGPEGENDSATEDSDTVVMHTDEADSSTDSGVQSKSLGSEDGMVDISMRDGEETAPRKPHLVSSKPLAAMLRPGAFITPAVRNLFEMKYIPSNGTEMIPTGLTTLSDESKNYSTLASRQPEPSVGAPVRSRMSVMERISERHSRPESPPTSDEDADDVPPAAQVPAQDSGDDSDGLPEVAELGKPGMGFGTFGRNTQRNSKGLITYSRKDDPSAPRLRRGEDNLPAEKSPLIRLGESILLDWNPESYDALFSGATHRANEEMRGTRTWENVDTLPDPELEEKRRSRYSRRKNGVTLGDCLDEFGKPEILSESDAWYCPRCKEHRRASKQFELWKSPDILVIHLKRFSAQGRFRDKLDVSVDFPIKGLDLTTRVAMQEEGKSPIYDLFAVDNHYGGLGGGHYTAYASNFMEENQTWYEYNDSSVSRRPDPQKVVTNAAYLLFYRRRSAHHLGGPNFEWLTAPDPNASESQPISRATSQAGEGKRLDDSSCNGSSSALRGVGAAHQAGGGGSAAEGVMIAPMRTGVDDDLPAYSENDPNTSTLDPRGLNMETDLDEDEGISMAQGPLNYISPRSEWSFDRLNYGENEQITAAPHTSDNDEDLFAGDNSSTKAAGSSFSNEDGDRMLDFQTDEGTTMGPFGTPPDDEVPLDVPLMQDQEEEPVAEVMITENDEFKMD